MAKSGRSGFTLIEVMLALAVLAFSLTVLLISSGANLNATRSSSMMAVASELARSKLYDIEEQLLQDGFGELDLELDGEFDDEGWPQIKWEAKVVKIELPNLDAMTQFAGGGEGEDGASNPLVGVLGMLGGGFGGLGGGGAEGADAATAAAGAVVSTQYELFRTVLEEAIRKITLTLSWKVGNKDKTLVIDLYITDPTAVTRRAGSMGLSPSTSGSGSGTGSGSTGTGSGSGTGSGTSPTRTVR